LKVNTNSNTFNGNLHLIYYVAKEDEEKAALAILNLARIENENLDVDAFAKDMGDIIRTYFYGSLKDIKIKNLFLGLVGFIIALMLGMILIHSIYKKGKL